MTSPRHSEFGGSYIPQGSCDFDFDEIDERLAGENEPHEEEVSPYMKEVNELRRVAREIVASKKPHKTAKIILLDAAYSSLLSVDSRKRVIWICTAVCSTTSVKDARSTAWAAAISFGALPAEHSGRSMTSISKIMDLTRQAVSKKARLCCARFALPPSHYMKSEESSASFRKARVKFIEGSQVPAEPA
jgi:hypothetical protein